MKALKLKSEAEARSTQLEQEAIARFRKILDPGPPPPDWRKRSGRWLLALAGALAPCELVREEGPDLEAIRLEAMNPPKREIWR